ncbi:hypothetical protein [Corynebacterium provencense]|uniref:hypothetical protein n=1 Tax=Corynebacterium provencense TaxID=1737425 RepID=UPI0013A6744C|nr:hypothetical protein [Corynebacterium provencense]
MEGSAVPFEVVLLGLVDDVEVPLVFVDEDEDPAGFVDEDEDPAGFFGALDVVVEGVVVEGVVVEGVDGSVVVPPSGSSPPSSTPLRPVGVRAESRVSWPEPSATAPVKALSNFQQNCFLSVEVDPSLILNWSAKPRQIAFGSTSGYGPSPTPPSGNATSG